MGGAPMRTIKIIRFKISHYGSKAWLSLRATVGDNHVWLFWIFTLYVNSKWVPLALHVWFTWRNGCHELGV